MWCVVCSAPLHKPGSNTCCVLTQYCCCQESCRALLSKKVAAKYWGDTLQISEISETDRTELLAHTGRVLQAALRCVPVVHFLQWPSTKLSRPTPPSWSELQGSAIWHTSSHSPQPASDPAASPAKLGQAARSTWQVPVLSLPAGSGHTLAIARSTKPGHRPAGAPRAAWAGQVASTATAAAAAAWHSAGWPACWLPTQGSGACLLARL